MRQKHKFPKCKRWCLNSRMNVKYCEDYLDRYGLISVDTTYCDNESVECFIRNAKRKSMEEQNDYCNKPGNFWLGRSHKGNAKSNEFLMKNLPYAGDLIV